MTDKPLFIIVLQGLILGSFSPFMLWLSADYQIGTAEIKKAHAERMWQQSIQIPHCQKDMLSKLHKLGGKIR